MRLTRRLTPAMAAKGEGYHINISSSAGKHPSPKQCAYSAAKWGMTGFALSSAKVSVKVQGTTGFPLSFAEVGLGFRVPLALLCHLPR